MASPEHLCKIDFIMWLFVFLHIGRWIPGDLIWLSFVWVCTDGWESSHIMPWICISSGYHIKFLLIADLISFKLFFNKITDSRERYFFYFYIIKIWWRIAL